MTYKEVGFRAFYHQFCVVPISDRLKNSLSGFPGEKDADGILTYGYYDREAGLTLEVLAVAHITDNSASFEEGSKDVRSFIRIGAVEDTEFMFLSDEDGSLKKRYSDKIEMLHHYDASEEVEETRKMRFLDSCRHDECIDDVLVYLTKDGLKPEGCWTRIIGLCESWFMGELLNEPYQDFGYHEGETIAFFLHENEDGSIICFTDMNPSAKITPEDLADGSMLEAAVTKFNSERNEPNFLDILEILRDSYVWIPCNAVMSDADRIQFDKIIKTAGEDLESLKGMTFATQDETRLIPDILKNGDDYFFPVFSNEENMGEYGTHFSKIQKHILEIIPLARNNEKQPIGIVLNAFTEPFVLDKEIWDILENMKSRIVEHTCDITE